MFVVRPQPDSWRQVARVVAREMPRLEVALLVAPARDEEAMAAFVLDGVRTVFVCDNEEDRARFTERFPEALCVAKPRKTPPLPPASPFPLELLRVSSQMLSPGLRDCLRIGRLARLNEVTPHGRPVCCVGGPDGLIDTAVVVVPGLRSDHADAHILETLCSPYQN